VCSQRAVAFERVAGFLGTDLAALFLPSSSTGLQPLSFLESKTMVH
jgi:hypothetical protein